MDKAAEAIFNGEDTKTARRACPSSIWKTARRKLDMINAAAELSDLKSPPGNELKALQKERKGQHAIRINDQYRICFRWTNEGAEDVEVTDYH